MRLQGVVYEGLHALCRRLPEEQVPECDLQVKTYLPKILHQTPDHVVSLTSSEASFYERRQ